MDTKDAYLKNMGKCIMGIHFEFLVRPKHLKYLDRDKMAAISQTTFSNAFSSMKIFEFRLQFLKFVPNGPINNSLALVQIMAWRRPGDKPLSEPMLVGSLTHICVTRPQWVNILRMGDDIHSSANWIAMSLGTGVLPLPEPMLTKHIEAETKWPPFCNRYFQMHFLEWKW